MQPYILIRGGGDLASGVALRLYRAGLPVVVSELAQPLAVRRSVSFAQAVYAGAWDVEEVRGRLVKREQVPAALEAGEVPVVVDPNASILSLFDFCAVIDARLTKQPPAPLPVSVPFLIGLGPGFCAGENCQAVVETRRSHTLGRVIWEGSPQSDSGQPEGDPRRVLRAPVDGWVVAHAQIGEHVEAGQWVAAIRDAARTQETPVLSPFAGVVRGLIYPGRHVMAGIKIGDVDPRDDPALCRLVSDKALAIGGGVLEALLDVRSARMGFPYGVRLET
ncbi:MAG: selenium-dependent molybdenum cofactor biosynthesis protein YqeB [Anaerolineales bacterium]